jgi:hypothetical protein
LAGQTNSPLLENIISGNKTLKEIFNQKHVYRPQIIFTQINRDAGNKPEFTSHYYNLDSSNYFYCASLVKLPVSIIALEKLNDLKIEGLNKSSYMFTDNVYPCQATCVRDTTSESGFPTVENYIRKMLLVSDNFSYSRLFEFTGPTYLHKRLKEMGYPMARIVHRFDPLCKGEANTCMNPIRFLDKNMNELYKQAADKNPFKPAPPLGNIVFGEDIIKNGKTISEKKDFTHSNFLPLSTIHSILQRLIFHRYLPVSQKFNISDDDQHFLVKHLGMYPRESSFPKYNSQTFHDSFKKYFIFGNKQKQITSDSVRIFNMIGYSYGFLIDCAYIVNYKTKTEFLLSAVIYTNKRNSFGSGVYEYESTGIPYLKELSMELYKHETKRNKTQQANLDEFNYFNYQVDTLKPEKIHIKGLVTVNNTPSEALIIVKSINNVYLYYPEVKTQKGTGNFSINLLPGETYELEIQVKDSPPQVVELNTRQNKSNDTIRMYIDFMSAHLDKIVKTKQDSLFTEMLAKYNRLSLPDFAAKYGDKKTDGLSFKVQIGAYKFIDNFNYAAVSGLPVIIRETFDDFVTRFTMGNYSTYNEAASLQDQVRARGIKDAFVFAVFKGKRLYLNEVLEGNYFK